MSIFTKYSDEYYNYKDESDKYDDALDYIADRLGYIKSNLSGLNDALKRYKHASISEKKVKGRPKNAYDNQYNKLLKEINEKVTLFRSTITYLYTQKHAVKEQLKTYNTLKNAEKVRCEKESDKK